MDSPDIPQAALNWTTGYGLQLAATAAVVLIYIVLDRISAPRLEEGAEHGRFRDEAGVRAVRVARTITGIVGLLFLLAVWGINFSALLVFATTAVTLLGVALFASWSLLSNVTAYFILLVQPSFRRGNFIRVIDLDNYIEGYISQLNLFNTTLVTESREVVTYPNNLLLVRPILVNPRTRLKSVGKLPEYKGPDGNDE